MKPARGYKPSLSGTIANYDFVIGIKGDKIDIIKDRNGTTETKISLSELFQRILFNYNNKEIEEALTPLIEKLKILEVFE